jgi:hypothetical protein
VGKFSDELEKETNCNQRDSKATAPTHQPHCYVQNLRGVYGNGIVGLLDFLASTETFRINECVHKTEFIRA